MPGIHGKCVLESCCNFTNFSFQKANAEKFRELTTKDNRWRCERCTLTKIHYSEKEKRPASRTWFWLKQRPRPLSTPRTAWNESTGPLTWYCEVIWRDLLRFSLILSRFSADVEKSHVCLLFTCLPHSAQTFQTESLRGRPQRTSKNFPLFLTPTPLMYATVCNSRTPP